jgi:hypothetical protein
MSTTRMLIPSARQKLHNFQKDPSGILRNKLKAILGNDRLLKIEDTSPIYDVRRWALNRAAKKAYSAEKIRMPLNALQLRIVNDLRENGIAVLHFNDLFPDRDFSEYQELAEALLQRPENQEQIRKVESGYKPDNPLGLVLKYFVVRLLGNFPVFDYNDKFVKVALSDEIQRIVCSYFDTFPRMTDMDYWCNIPKSGPGLYSQNWHRDSEDHKLVKMFIWVRDVDLNTGPFHYILGSHMTGKFGNFYPQTRLQSQYPPLEEVEKKFSQDQMKVFTGKAGTMILCDTSGLHKGGAPLTGKRLLFTSLFSSNAGWDYGDRFRIAGLKREKLSPAAQYATGRLVDTPAMRPEDRRIYDK